MLKEVKLKFGSNSQQAPLLMEPAPMTVFVGPNNSGKSLALSEIQASINMRRERENSKIISRVELKRLDKERYEEIFLALRRENLTPSEEALSIRFPDGTNFNINMSGAAQELSKGNLPEVARQLSQGLTIRLDGNTRLTLTQPSTTDSPEYKNTLLWRLFSDKAARERLRKHIQSAFGLYLTIDPTDLNVIRTRMSERPPQAPEEDEWALDERGRRFFSQAQEIIQFSDGIKAYTGLVAAVLSYEYRVILIDEPEAFLHPPLIRQLGKTLTELSAERDGNVFVASHSSDFLMGCVQSNRKVTVVRLTYKQGVPSARHLPADEIQEMMSNPFLRSTGVLSALFHDGAIVCEADTDRAFYQEINERLIEHQGKGISNSLFLNANGKDSLRYIIQPLRKMGIPAAAIVDLDIIEPGSTFTLLLQAACVPRELSAAWRSVRDTINAAFVSMNQKPKKSGINVLDKTSRELVDNLIGSLKEYGIFIVPTGEVENWLPELQVKGHGPNWLKQIFEKIWTDSATNKTIKPTGEDVWKFLNEIAIWVANPMRKGIPN